MSGSIDLEGVYSLPNAFDLEGARLLHRSPTQISDKQWGDGCDGR